MTKTIELSQELVKAEQEVNRLIDEIIEAGKEFELSLYEYSSGYQATLFIDGNIVIMDSKGGHKTIDQAIEALMSKLWDVQKNKLKEKLSNRRMTLIYH
jgi:ribosome-associated translation inhibitor RaiA